MSDWVPEQALNYEEIYRRGGRTCRDEDFSLFKCPPCGQIYLMDYEVDTVFLNAADLSQRASAVCTTLTCVRCARPLPEGRWLWNGKEPDDEVKPFAVTWQELMASEWQWAVNREAIPPEHRS